MKAPIRSFVDYFVAVRTTYEEGNSHVDRCDVKVDHKRRRVKVRRSRSVGVGRPMMMVDRLIKHIEIESYIGGPLVLAEIIWNDLGEKLSAGIVAVA